MGRRDPLERYRGKRKAGRTSEPGVARGGARRRRRSGQRFAIQKHDASTLHYDFRLEQIAAGAGGSRGDGQGSSR